MPYRGSDISDRSAAGPTSHCRMRCNVGSRACPRRSPPRTPQCRYSRVAWAPAVSAAQRSRSRLPPKDQCGGAASHPKIAAVTLRQGDLAVRYLDLRVGLSPQLPDRLDDLGHATAVHRVVVAKATAVGVERQLPEWSDERAVEHEVAALAFFAKTDVLDQLDNRDREAVIDRGIVDVAPIDARLFEGNRRRVDRPGVGEVDMSAVRVLRGLAVPEQLDAL